MLSQLLEKFVKRLCGRWLRDFDSSQIKMSLGGTVTLEALDLKTEELAALLLPYAPAHARVAALTLVVDPLQGSLRVDVAGVDVALTGRDRFDAAEARAAVERAVHLYFVTYLREPKKGTGAGAGALLDLLRSSELSIRRLHVHVAQRLPARALGDGCGPRVRAGLFLARLDVTSAPGAGMRKNIYMTGLAAYCADGESVRETAWHDAAMPEAATGRAARDAAQRHGAVVFSADALAVDASFSVDAAAALGAAGAWLTAVETAVTAKRVRLVGSDLLRRFVLDAAYRSHHAHRRRQDVSRGGSRWARAIAMVRADLGRTTQVPSDARRWRRYFGEWRACAAYVAQRKLLAGRVKCAVFADRATGEAFYELGESFAGSAGTIMTEDLTRAEEAVRRLMRPRRYAYPDNYAPPVSAAAEFEDEDLELDGWDRDDVTTAIQREEELDESLARALDAQQRACDARWPVEKAAACRAIAARHLREPSIGPGEVLVLAIAGAASVPAATVTVTQQRSVRVDVRVGASNESFFAEDAMTSSAKVVVEDDACAFSEILEVPVALQAERTLRVQLIEVGATYDSVLASTEVSLVELEPPPSRKGTRTTEIVLDLTPKSMTDGFFSRILTASCTLRVVVGRLAPGHATGPARKAVAGHLARFGEEKTKPLRDTSLAASLHVEDLDVRMEDYRLTAATLTASSDPMSVPCAEAHRPGGAGEGSVAYACSRAIRELLRKEGPAEVVRCEGAVLTAPGRAVQEPWDLSFWRVGRVEEGWFDPARATDVRVLLHDGALARVTTPELRVAKAPLDELAALLSREYESGAWSGAWDCDGYRIAALAPVEGACGCLVGAPISALTVAGAPPRVVVVEAVDDSVAAPVPPPVDDAVGAPAPVALPSPRDAVGGPTPVVLPSPTKKSCCVVS